jgi:hypothetical protein
MDERVPATANLPDGRQAGLLACGGINFSPRVVNDKTLAYARVFVTTLWSHLDFFI